MKYYIAHVKLVNRDTHEYMIEGFEMDEDDVYTPRQKWDKMYQMTCAIAGYRLKVEDIHIFEASESICKFLKRHNSVAI